MERLADQEILALSAESMPDVDWSRFQVEPIHKGGSDRSYWRLFSVEWSVIFMAYTDRRPDNFSFAPATEILQSLGVSVPRILAHNPGRRYLWSEDAGSRDLWDLRGDPWMARRPLYEAALEQAARIHRISPDAFPESQRRLLQPDFDESLYRWEQDYFFDHFADTIPGAEKGAIESIRRGAAFAELAKELASLPRCLVHRDLQSQNVIVREVSSPAEAPVMLIDYQGLRGGRPEYDIASLLLDPYVDIDSAGRESLIGHYRNLREGEGGWDWNAEVYAKCAAQRLMQALGAYGYLGNVLGKSAFLRHIPVAAARLREVLRSAGILAELSDFLNPEGGFGID